MGQSLATRLLGFSGLPVISAIAPFVLLPVLAHRVSPAEWAGLGIGQSVGMMSAIAVMLGWQLFGPSAVAGVSHVERQEWYLQSVGSRLLALCVILPLCVAVCYAVTPEGGRSLAIALGAAIAISGLTPVWYFIATSRPMGIAAWDTLPRVAATLLCAPLVMAGASPLIYAGALAIATALSVTEFSRRTLQGLSIRQYLADPRFRVRLRLSLVPVSTELASNAYSSGATALFSVRGSLEEIAAFSSLYRLYRLATYVAAAVVQALQGWVVEPSTGAARAQRMQRSLTALSVFGFFAGILMWLVLPTASRLLFTETYSVSEAAAAWAGLALAAWFACASIGRLILVPTGRGKVYLWVTISSALVGVPSMVFAPAVGNETMGSGALATTQVICLLLLLKPCLRSLALEKYSPERNPNVHVA